MDGQTNAIGNVQSSLFPQVLNAIHQFSGEAFVTQALIHGDIQSDCDTTLA